MGTTSQFDIVTGMCSGTKAISRATEKTVQILLSILMLQAYLKIMKRRIALGKQFKSYFNISGQESIQNVPARAAQTDKA
jgi:hypothetical protein